MENFFNFMNIFNLFESENLYIIIIIVISIDLFFNDRGNNYLYEKNKIVYNSKRPPPKGVALICSHRLRIKQRRHVSDRLSFYRVHSTRFDQKQ